MLTLIKEDGTGLPNANSYADVVDGSAYHEGHLYATAWTGATAGNQAAALVMATRVIDAMFRFKGFKAVAAQALQWPRRTCPDIDSDSVVRLGTSFTRGCFLSENAVPAAAVAATCELARELLVSDLTAAPPGDGLKAIRLEGAMKLDFDPKGKPAVVPRLVQQMLSKLGEYTGAASGSVRLVRV
jgi:hypothetical protein